MDDLDITRDTGGQLLEADRFHSMVIDMLMDEMTLRDFFEQWKSKIDGSSLRQAVVDWCKEKRHSGMGEQRFLDTSRNPFQLFASLRSRLPEEDFAELATILADHVAQVVHPGFSVPARAEPVHQWPVGSGEAEVTHAEVQVQVSLEPVIPPAAKVIRLDDHRAAAPVFRAPRDVVELINLLPPPPDGGAEVIRNWLCGNPWSETSIGISIPIDETLADALMEAEAEIYEDCEAWVKRSGRQPSEMFDRGDGEMAGTFLRRLDDTRIDGLDIRFRENAIAAIGSLDRARADGLLAAHATITMGDAARLMIDKGAALVLTWMEEHPPQGEYRTLPAGSLGRTRLDLDSWMQRLAWLTLVDGLDTEQAVFAACYEFRAGQSECEKECGQPLSLDEAVAHIVADPLQPLRRVGVRMELPEFV